MAREAGDIASAVGLEPVYVARDERELDNWSFSAQVILEQVVEQYSDMQFVIGIGDGSIRKSVADRFGDNLRFTNLIHPTASFGVAQLNELSNCRGTIIAAGARLASGISIGDFCIFNQNSTVSHDCVLGNFVHIAPGANVLGSVYLRDGCWVGAGAVINQGEHSKKLEVGENTVVGSGAVVINDCAPNAVYAGVPANRMK